MPNNEQMREDALEQKRLWSERVMEVLSKCDPIFYKISGQLDEEIDFSPLREFFEREKKAFAVEQLEEALKKSSTPRRDPISGNMFTPITAVTVFLEQMIAALQEGNE